MKKTITLSALLFFLNVPCYAELSDAWVNAGQSGSHDVNVDIHTDTDGNTTGKIGNDRINIHTDNNGNTTGTIKDETPRPMPSVYAPFKPITSTPNNNSFKEIMQMLSR